ncbi:hypothetical protein [Mesorhizobium sp.]|uniref:hypothetical protein n=1 Tax=Mesorhizobium sp. TaxID=1871066 RepID=UPI000FE7A558|nr:hypothetical protein [Mesorhizobium sp.]RWP79584.1 MAG: hypothetical protein EOR09_02815 [Mesorhizobium sp.]
MAKPSLAIFAIVVAGLVLRLLGARGDLWLDEIWSFSLIEPLTSINQIFWRVNHDNNHFLNSAYLYLIGPDTSPLLQRGLSIAFGASTIVAAAAVPCGRWAMISTSLLFAVSYPMVHYGSEARGYAGLVLFTLLSVVFLERWLDKRGSSVIALAAAILLGLLSHLTMIEMVPVLVAWTTWVTWLRTERIGRTLADVGLTFTPAVLAVLPLAICVVVGAQLSGFVVGGVSPFSFQAFAKGYGGVIRYLLGPPSWIGDWACIAAACGMVCISAGIWRDRRASLYVIGIVGLPALMCAANLPNLQIPRYFIVSGTLLLLWTGEMLGRGFDAGGFKRYLAAGALAVMMSGSISSLLQFYEYGRGSYASIVGQMTQNGATTYASNHDFRTAMVVDYFAARTGRQAWFVPKDELCIRRPAWLIMEGDPDIQSKRVEPASACALAYERTDASRNWGLSGLSWTLYRRRD